MAKKSEATPQAPETPAATTPAEPAADTTTTALAPAGGTAIAPAAAVSPEFAARKALAERLPDFAKAKALMLKRPTPEELMNIVMALPAANQEAMMNLVAKTNPEKQGLHTASSGFEPTVLKLYHGVGNDPVKPRQTLPGQFYSADSRVVGEKFIAVPIAIYEGQILWPPQDQGKNENKAPICVSVDRKIGSKYGDCDKCPLNPQARQYTQGGCMPEVTAYLLDQDMTSIYELKFVKTSFGAGKALINILKKQNQIWDRWFVFEAKERVDGAKKWYVAQTSTPTDAAKIDSPKELHPLFAALSKIIDVDVYYKKMADNYTRSKNGGAEGAETPAPAFDEKKFMAGDDSAAPDYSKDV